MRNTFVSSSGARVTDRKAPKMTAQEHTIYELAQKVNMLENFILRELLNDMGQVRNLLFAYLRLTAKPNELAPEVVKYSANEAFSKNLLLRCEELDSARKEKLVEAEKNVKLSEETRETINATSAGMQELLAEEEQGATMADENEATEADETEKPASADQVDQAKVDAEDAEKAEDAEDTEADEEEEKTPVDAE